MQESIHALRCDFLCLQDSGPSRGQPRHTFRTRIIYACAQLIDGLGHAARSATVPVSHSFPEMTVISGKWPFYYSGVRSSEAAVGHLVACSGRISVDRQRDTLTDRMTTVTLAAHARWGVTTSSLNWKGALRDQHGKLQACVCVIWKWWQHSILILMHCIPWHTLFSTSYSVAQQLY